ncbi:MmgE/PrpD family protein [Variovorax paradoxus]|uniref:MmgE/PrpD family protein n=1 Tax=Variovorax paradoxus TaxID=34073 RepID=UPI0029C66D23|nr:MmgE/PrpD family protein [Variovorax paradoxus]
MSSEQIEGMSDQLNSPSAAERISTFLLGFAEDNLTPAHHQLCARSLADTYAVALGGCAEPASESALRYLGDSGLLHPESGPRLARLWGRCEWASAEIAAWHNGVLGHVLDYDDVNVPLRGHPSVVLWPALIAVAQARDLDGSRLNAAFVVGLEVLVKLSRGFAASHYAAGWHSTASMGVLGATVACAYLLKLDASQITHAMGFAVAQAAGSRENVGTQAKSFQAGQASGAAVRAALLAAAGFEAGEHAIDGPHGYLSIYAGGFSADEWLARLGDLPLEVERSGLDVKQYPMCYATHRAIDAVLSLREEHGLRIGDVERVDVTGSAGAFVPLVHPRPETGLEGKFSLPYAMAAALLDGEVRLASFTDEAVSRPEVQRFLAQVDWREEEGAVAARSADVRLQLRDGRSVSRRVEVLRGSSQLPLSNSQLEAKLEDCLNWGRPAQHAGAGARLLRHCQALRETAFINRWVRGLEALTDSTPR